LSESQQLLRQWKLLQLLAESQLADTQEIKRWIMSFGPSATVLQPVELAEEICNDLTRMLNA
jgi:predicted DNA-binding transcriptional regulator YafY